MPDIYGDLFDFYLKLYDDEISRFRELDNKISRYLSAYSILIALTGFVGINLRFLLDGQSTNWLVLINYIFLAIVLLLLIPGWYYLLSALKLENLQRFAYDESIIRFFSDNSYIDIKYALSYRAKDAIEYNVEAGNKKSKKIAKAFKWSFPAMGFFVASLLLAMFNVYSIEYNKKDGVIEEEMSILKEEVKNLRSLIMSTTQPENANQQTQAAAEAEQQNKPDLTVEAPQNVLITEGYEPPEKTTMATK